MMFLAVAFVVVYAIRLGIFDIWSVGKFRTASISV